MATLSTKNGFDWRLIAWNRPGTQPRDLCAYCHGKITRDEIPLEISRDTGAHARFCDACVKEYFSV